MFPTEDEELDDEVDEDELDIEEEEEEEDDDGSPLPFEPPEPQAGSIVAHASMPATITGARRRSSLRSAFAEHAPLASMAPGAVALGLECGLGGIERASSRIVHDLQRHSV
jgi:hypothetical protein